MTNVQRMVARQTRSTAAQQAPAGAPGQARTARPLPDGVRARVEAAFGADFSDVSVREDGDVGSLEAVALTQGSQIAFEPGTYHPDSPEGLEVLGHELAHVLQQRAGRVAGSGLTDDPALEAEADEAGRRAGRGQPVDLVGSTTSAGPDGAARTGPDGVAQPMRRRDREPMQDALEPEADQPGRSAFRSPFAMSMPAFVAAEPGGGFGVPPARRYGPPLPQPAPPVVPDPGPPQVVAEHPYDPPDLVPGVPAEHPYDPPDLVPGLPAEGSEPVRRDRRTSL